jgi:hypothetical protein
MSERLSRERLDTIIRMIVSARGPKVADEIADHIAALEAEAEWLRETNKRLNRRCSKAEAIANKSIEQLRNEGQRNFGRMLANYAAAHYAREVERLQRVIVATPRDDGLVCWWCDQQVWTHADDESEPTYHPELHKEDCEYRLAEAALGEEVGE